MTSQLFGDFIKSKRVELRMGLREFCVFTGTDPSNWSKVERGIIPAPRDEQSHAVLCVALKIQIGSAEHERLVDLANLSQGRLPPEALTEPEIVKQMPIFWRGKDGHRPTAKECRDLFNAIRKLHSVNR
jgi:hypothetical protein